MSAPGAEAEAEHKSNPRFLLRQPRALQWFENGRLVKRHEEERQAGKGDPCVAKEACHSSHRV